MRWLSSIRFTGILLLLMGCAQANELDAWSRFEQYREELSQPVEERRHELFVSERLQAADASEKEVVRAQVEFPLWFGEIMSRHQKKSSAQRSCLTLNGQLTDDRTYASVSVEYVRESGELMINDVYYQYLDGPEGFPEAARCPADIELVFPS